MRFLTADYLFPLHIAPIKKGVLKISEKGEVVRIFENREVAPQSKLEIFKGILCPGFVNAHCHLELSHLLGKTKKGKPSNYLLYENRHLELPSYKNTDN